MGTNKNWNYLLEDGSLVVQASPLGECSRNPSVSVYQLALLWEAVFGFSEVFGRLFQCVCPFHDGRFTSAPVHAMASVQQFLTQNSMTPIPHSPYSCHIALSDLFLVFLDEKIPQREMFHQCERGETNKQTKNGRITKSHRNLWVQKLSSGENVSIGVLNQMESTSKVTEIWTCKNTHKIFYKFQDFLVPASYLHGFNLLSVS